MSTESTQSCFVVMPIRKEGSEEFQHFRALHDTVITPALKELGYEVTRADDVASVGSIAADVVRRLATADVVIADLTDLNANVFYELGIRHALRGQGTIMIVDTSTTDIPFDLKPYRVIEFTPDLRGIEKLRTSLVTFVRAIQGKVPDPAKDNPVHDHLPSLPDDIYSNVQGSIEGELREEIARLRNYLRRHGAEFEEHHTERDADNVVALALAQAERGELPVDLVQKAHLHARQGERLTFLSVLRQLTSGSPAAISATEWLTLSRDASNLELPDEVRLALLDRAIELRPRDRNVRRYQLEALAHSESPVQREKAREALLDHLGIVISDGKVSLPERMPPSDVTTAAIMLDAYHRDDLDENALKITSALLEAYPDNTIVLRNHARALRIAGEGEKSRAYYRRALLSRDADGTTANWFGTTLASTDHVDAAEVYLYGCQLEPQLAENYADAADELSAAFHLREIGRNEGRPLADGIDKSIIEKLLLCAFSCQNIDAHILELAGDVVATAELDPGLPDLLLALRRGSVPGFDTDIRLLNVRERLDVVKEVYSYLVSDLTQEPI
jgi:hypothetical protein